MPKRVDAEEQRRKIADATITVICKTGVAGARLRDVAAQASVTTGSVMHYFDDKDAVLAAALEEVVRRTLSRMQKGRGPSSDISVFLRRFCQYLPLDQVRSDEWRVWIAFWGRAVVDVRLREIHRQYYAQIIEGLVPSIAALGIANPKRLRLCADSAIAAIDGVGTRATLEVGDWSAKRQKDTLKAMLLPMLSNQ